MENGVRFVVKIMVKKRSKTKTIEPNDGVSRRLDALIRVFVETLHETNRKKFNETTVVRMLNSAGLTPTEIAKILGKKDRRAISPHLYSKRKKNKTSEGDPNDNQK